VTPLPTDSLLRYLLAITSLCIVLHSLLFLNMDDSLVPETRVLAVASHVSFENATFRAPI
jgi:hypothetical protein